MTSEEDAGKKTFMSWKKVNVIGIAAEVKPMTGGNVKTTMKNSQ